MFSFKKISSIFIFIIPIFLFTACSIGKKNNNKINKQTQNNIQNGQSIKIININSSGLEQIFNQINKTIKKL